MKLHWTGCVGVLAGLLVTASGAQAADLGSVKDYGDAAVDMPQWAGNYVGAGVVATFGGAVVHSGASGGKLNLANSTTAGGMVAIGHNWQFGSWVAGVEANLSYTDSEQKGSDGVLGSVTAREQDLGALKLRGGYAFGNMLLYGTTGFEVTHAKLSGSQFSTANTVNLTLLVGAGFEYAFERNWTFRTEAKVYGMGQNDIAFTGGSRDINEGALALTFGISRKF